MQTWFECKVKYTKVNEGGHEQKVNDTYLFDAVSFTDAETRIFHQMQKITRGDFQVTNIKKSNITEIFPNDDGEWWYKAKISLVSIDEEAGKEKKFNNYALVMASDIKEALDRLEKGLSYLLVPYVTTSISVSTIADVFPYFEDEERPTLKPSISESKPVTMESVTEDYGTQFGFDDDEVEPLEGTEEDDDDDDDELEHSGDEE